MLTNPQWEQIHAQQQGFSGMFAWAQGRFNIAPSGETHYVDEMCIRDSSLVVGGGGRRRVYSALRYPPSTDLARQHHPVG